MNKEELLISRRKRLEKKMSLVAPLRESISKLQSEITIEQRQHLIGKYYVYKNSGGIDNKKWNLYVKPICVLNGFQVRVLMAQKSDYKTEIVIEDTSGDHLFEKEITEEEFNEGFNNILNEVNNYQSQ